MAYKFLQTGTACGVVVHNGETVALLTCSLTERWTAFQAVRVEDEAAAPVYRTAGEGINVQAYMLSPNAGDKIAVALGLSVAQSE